METAIKPEATIDPQVIAASGAVVSAACVELTTAFTPRSGCPTPEMYLLGTMFEKFAMFWSKSKLDLNSYPCNL
jgi:hypothetical protein